MTKQNNNEGIEREKVEWMEIGFQGIVFKIPKEYNHQLVKEAEILMKQSYGEKSKEKEMLKKINGFLEENKVDNRKEFCYKFTSEAWNTFLHKEELHPNWLIKQKLKGDEK